MICSCNLENMKRVGILHNFLFANVKFWNYILRMWKLGMRHQKRDEWIEAWNSEARKWNFFHLRQWIKHFQLCSLFTKNFLSKSILMYSWNVRDYLEFRNSTGITRSPLLIQRLSTEMNENRIILKLNCLQIRYSFNVDNFAIPPPFLCIHLNWKTGKFWETIETRSGERNFNLSNHL